MARGCHGFSVHLQFHGFSKDNLFFKNATYFFKNFRVIWQQKISYRFLNIWVLWGLLIGCFSNKFAAQFWLFVSGLFVGISFEDINWRWISFPVSFVYQIHQI